MQTAPLLPNWGKDFPVIGHGTIIFNFTRMSDFYIRVRPNLDSDEAGADEYIQLTVTEDSASFTMCHNKKISELQKVTGSVNDQPVGWDPEYKTSYWFSYNRDLLQLKYGKGYYMEETTLLTHDFIDAAGPMDRKTEETFRENYKYLFSPYIRRRIEQYDIAAKDELVKQFAYRMKDTLTYQGKPIPEIFPSYAASTVAEEEVKLKELAMTMIDVEKKVSYDQNPFVVNWSPLVLDSSKMNMFILNSNDYTFSASLPAACQELYSNVIGANVQLDWPGTDLYKLSDAIQHSIDDKNGILRKKLKSKDKFGKFEMTYLRVTLGPSRGKSAGIPYVLEIWPQGHGSPIHSHGNCYAVITVLHGGLTVDCFNKQTRTTDATALKKFDVTKGDTTWISPNWFQTHKLWNHHKSTFCCTMQCYQYGKTDMVRYPYFDYVSEEETIDEFFPNSDYDFREMRDLVMEEYTKYMNNKKVAK